MDEACSAWFSSRDGRWQFRKVALTTQAMADTFFYSLASMGGSLRRMRVAHCA